MTDRALALAVFAALAMPLGAAPQLGTGGSDDCAEPDAIALVGSWDFDLSTATTGAQGQAESLCYAFGSSGIESDVWFTWRANVTGSATFETCGGTALDTRMAVYASGGCPSDGSALACSDDACNEQSSITFSCVEGASYLVQIGLFPGAPAGTGTFEISSMAAPQGCPDYSDGTSGTDLGIGNGGDFAMLQYYDCLQDIACVQSAFGLAGPPNPELDGLPVTVAVYADTDADPLNGMTLLATRAGVTTLAQSDVFSSFAIDPPVAVNGSGWVAVIISCHPSQQEPFSFDPGPVNHGTWHALNYCGTLDPQVLTQGGPQLVQTSLLIDGVWLMRASEAPCLTGGPPGDPFCFGSGCPCGNDDPQAGCVNSFGSGALLLAGGSASVAGDSLTLTATGLVTNQPSILFSADEALNGGAGLVFGDGLRCAGGNVRRLGTQTPGAGRHLIWGPGLIAMEAGSPGDLRRFQCWYRDPAAGGGPCGSGFNLSNAVEVSYSP